MLLVGLSGGWCGMLIFVSCFSLYTNVNYGVEYDFLIIGPYINLPPMSYLNANKKEQVIVGFVCASLFHTSTITHLHSSRSTSLITDPPVSLKHNALNSLVKVIATFCWARMILSQIF